MTKIINKVNEFRLLRNKTQEDVAEGVGVSRQTIIAIEKGNYTPSVLLALRLSQYFNVRVEDIFSTYDKK